MNIYWVAGILGASTVFFWGCWFYADTKWAQAGAEVVKREEALQVAHKELRELREEHSKCPKHGPDGKFIARRRIKPYKAAEMVASGEAFGGVHE